MKFKFLLIILNFLILQKVSADEVGDVLKNVVNEMNKSLPMQLDKETRLDNVTYFLHTLTARHTLINFVAKHDSFKRKEMYAMLKTKICTKPDTLLLLKERVSFLYQYYDKNHNFVSEIEIKYNDCK